MTIGGWELWSLATKALALLATAGVVGGFFSLWLVQRRQFQLPAVLQRYVLVCAVLGLIALPLFLLVQIGGINQSGVSGMFDATITNIVLHSSLGTAVQVRWLGFVLAALAWWLLSVNANAAARQRVGTALAVVAVVLLGVSLALTGHVATLSIIARVLLVLRVLMVFLWIGSLYPLLRLSSALPLPQVATLMQDFGRIAMVIVMLLLLAGVMLALFLLRAPGVLSTPYGHALLLKLALVGVLLLLAAINNLALVPRLETHATLPRLQSSIRREIVVALLIVMITTWLTTMVGPGL